jgi:hypothetical protein
MLVISLITLIEEATASSDLEHLSGHIRDPEKLFDPESLKALDAVHAGPLGFLAFVPNADQAITDYLLEGTLAADSGPQLLVLLVASVATAAVQLSHYTLGDWLDVEISQHPAYELIRQLFKSGPVPPLPGVAFFSSLVGEQEAIYVGLTDLAGVAAARMRLRLLFSLADRAWTDASGKREAFISGLAVALLRSDVQFQRTGRVSMREWLVAGYKFAQRHKSEIVSVISFGAKLAPTVL